MKPNKGNRFDVFMNVAAGNDTRAIPSNEEIRRRNLAEHAADLAAEEKANADAAAIAERTAKEKELGITDVMNAVRATEAQKAERIARVYSRDFDILASHAADRGEHAIDPFHQMVLQATPSDRSSEDVEKASDAFFAILEDEGTILSEDDKRRVLVYVGLNGIGLADKGVFIDPMAQGTWRGALARLTEMGAIKPKRQSRTEPKPLEITDSTSREHDGKVVYNELVDVAGNLFGAWLHSLSTNFAFVPSKLQLDAAVEMLERLALPLYDRASFDQVRIKLCVKKIWPEQCLTVDEYIAHILMEKYDLNDSRQKQAFKEECNRVRYQSGS